MMSALLKHLLPFLQDHAESLFKVARKGFNAIRSFVRRILGSESATPKAAAARSTSGGALDRLLARAERVMREREHARAKSRGSPAPTAEPATSTAQAIEGAAAATEASTTAATDVAAASSPPASAKPKNAVSATSPARRTSVITHPPDWLVTLAPLGARALVSALGSGRHAEWTRTIAFGTLP